MMDDGLFADCNTIGYIVSYSINHLCAIMSTVILSASFTDLPGSISLHIVPNHLPVSSITTSFYYYITLVNDRTQIINITRCRYPLVLFQISEAPNS